MRPRTAKIQADDEGTAMQQAAAALKIRTAMSSTQFYYDREVKAIRSAPHG